jgi:hypothetical protein
MYYSSSAGAAPTPGSSYLDNARRIYDLTDQVAALNPRPTPFFSYINRLRRKPTSDPKFVMQEERHQWQRQDVEVHTALGGLTVAANLQAAGLKLSTYVDEYGRVTAGTKQRPIFLVVGDVLMLAGELNTAGTTYEDVIVQARIASLGAAGADNQAVTVDIEAVANDADFATTYAGKTLRFAEEAKGINTGGTFAEGTGSPDGWTDQLYGRDGYCEIVKTSVPVVTGTAMATEFRGRKNEWLRIWGPKMMEHKFKVSRKMLTQVGKYGPATGTSKPARYTWGFIPYTERFGISHTFTYAKSGYKDFMDFMEAFLEPEKGLTGMPPLVPTSRKVLGWLNAFSDAGFLQNTFKGSKPVLNYGTATGVFGHELTVIKTIWGSLAFVEEALLKGMYGDYALVMSLEDLAYRPLVGNGISRDTFVKTNVQDNDADGRKDTITTEAGFQELLPEKQAVLKWK